MAAPLMDLFLGEARRFSAARAKTDIVKWEAFLKTFRSQPEAIAVCLEVIKQLPHDTVGLVAAQVFKDLLGKQQAAPRPHVMAAVLHTVAALLHEGHHCTFQSHRDHPILLQLAVAISSLLAEETLHKADLASVSEYAQHVTVCVHGLVTQLTSLYVPAWYVIQVLAHIPEHHPSRLPQLIQRTASRQAAHLQVAGCYLAASALVVQYLDTISMTPSDPAGHGLRCKALACACSWLRLAIKAAEDRNSSVSSSCLRLWHNSSVLQQTMVMAEGAQLLGGETMCCLCELMELLPEDSAVVQPLWMERLCEAVQMVTHSLQGQQQHSSAMSTALMASLTEALCSLLRACRHEHTPSAEVMMMRVLGALHDHATVLAELLQQQHQQQQGMKLCYEHLQLLMTVWTEMLPSSSSSSSGAAAAALAQTAEVAVFFSRLTPRLLLQQHQHTAYLDELQEYRSALRDYLRELAAQVPQVIGNLITALLTTGIGAYPEAEALLHALTAVIKDAHMSSVLLLQLCDQLSADPCAFSRPLCRMAVLLLTELLAVTLPRGTPEEVLRIAGQWRRVVLVSLRHAEQMAQGVAEGEHAHLMAEASALPFRVKQDHIGAVCALRMLPSLLTYAMSNNQQLLLLQGLWGAEEGSLLLGLSQHCLPIAFAAQTHAQAHAQGMMSWKSFSILFGAFSYLLTARHLLLDDDDGDDSDALGLRPLLMAVLRVIADKVTGTTASLTDAWAQHAARCEADMLLSILLQICRDAAAVLTAHLPLLHDDDTTGIMKVIDRSLAICSSVCEFLAVLLVQGAGGMGRWAAKEAELLLSSVTSLSQQLRLCLTAAVARGLLSAQQQVMATMRALLEQHCLTVRALLPHPQLRALTGASALLTDLAACCSLLPGGQDALVQFIGTVWQLGHERTQQQQPSGHHQAQAQGQGQGVYRGLDLGMDRESDRELEAARGRHTDPTLPLLLRFTAQALQLTDLHHSDGLSHQLLGWTTIAGMAEDTWRQYCAASSDAEVCRLLVEVIGLLAGPVPVPGGQDLWDSRAACSEEPVGDAQLAQLLIAQGQAYSMVRTLGRLLADNLHSDLRDPASRAMGKLCFAFGAKYTLQALLHALTQEPAACMQAERAMDVCGQMLTAALAGNWRKLRSHLKTLSKR